jgi:hypothetical protein
MKKVSILFGLFQYHSGPDGAGTRLFYIPLGKGADVPRNPAPQTHDSKPS